MTLDVISSIILTVVIIICTLLSFYRENKARKAEREFIEKLDKSFGYIASLNDAARESIDRFIKYSDEIEAKINYFWDRLEKLGMLVEENAE